MKKMIFFIFFMAGATYLPAQTIKGDQAEPKYIPSNQADSYMNFLVVANDNKATIEVSSMKNVRDYTFYILKGVISDNGKESWTILKTYRNSTPGFRRTIVDKIADDENIMYRIMVIDKDQHIEYTPIRCLNNEPSDNMKFVSND